MNSIVVAMLALDVHQQLGDGGLHRDVERGDRLVGDHDLRRAGEGAGDADALLLAARELARHPFGEGARAFHQVEQLEHLASRSALLAPVAEFLQHADDLAPTVWLGFSVSNGFWNTIWIAGDGGGRARSIA